MTMEPSVALDGTCHQGVINPQGRSAWKLWLDDVRECPVGYVCARSTREALSLVRDRGFPVFMSLDHDLGVDGYGNLDTTMIFLRRLESEFWSEGIPVPAYTVHSANPVGKLNIIAFMDSWRRALTLDV